MSASSGEFEANRIVHGSCEDLSTLPDQSVALTVTSPPYWNAIDYDRHAADPTQWYRTRGYADARETLETVEAAGT